MRIMWLSNSPWTPSGYGQQSKMWLERFRDSGHEMACTNFYGLEGGVINMNGITCYPKFRHIYGNDISVAHSLNFKADFLLSLMDVWVMNPEEYPIDFRWVPWYPIDHEHMPGIIRQKLAQAWKRIAMSKFGVEETHRAGLECMYVPHGVETSVFKPGDKAEARQRLGLPQDKWIVGTVAMNKGNPSRKNFTEMMEAFAAFHAVHKDTIYLVHAERGEGTQDMVNLPELASFFGLQPNVDVLFPDPYFQILGFSPEHMASVYQALDVHMLVGAGEGFGIPTLEAQACGCPVIVGDWTAMGELCFAGHKIDKKDAHRTYSPLAEMIFRPEPRAVEIALHDEFKHPSSGERAARMAKEEYDADFVFENNWKPALAEIQKGIEEREL
jgi:glycosyltransferase involved in cell wall biosynthesis